jgi:hypothetical protein
MKWTVTIIGSLIAGVYAVAFGITSQKIIGIFYSQKFEQDMIVIGYWGLGLILGLLIKEK